MSNSDISDFISKFKGGARSDRFRCKIFWPAIVGSPTVDETIFITSCDIVGSTVPPATVFFMGRAIQILGDRQVEQFAISVVNDIDYAVRDKFVKWMNGVMSVKSNVQASSDWHDLLGRIMVQQLDRDGETVLKEITMSYIFPDQVSPIQLDFSAENQVEVFSVNFAVNLWDTNDGNVT